MGIIMFMDRICISAAGPRMQAELGISSDEWGWVLGAFCDGLCVVRDTHGRPGRPHRYTKSTYPDRSLVVDIHRFNRRRLDIAAAFIDPFFVRRW